MNYEKGGSWECMKHNTDSRLKGLSNKFRGQLLRNVGTPDTDVEGGRARGRAERAGKLAGRLTDERPQSQRIICSRPQNQ